jgi:hypothetical protein
MCRERKEKSLFSIGEQISAASSRRRIEALESHGWLSINPRRNVFRMNLLKGCIV